MGLVQRIFYFHVPAALTAMLSAHTSAASRARCFSGGGRPARRPRRAGRRRTRGRASALISLVTGPLWARKAWGVWWDWDARLTSTLVMWMVFVAYLHAAAVRRRRIRSARGGGRALRRRAGAVRVLVGQLLAHAASEDDRAANAAVGTCWQPCCWCLAAFIVLATALLLVRVRLESARASLERAYLALED